MLSEMCVGDLIGEPGGDIQTGPFGTKLKAAEYTTQGVPIISVGEVGYGRLRVHRKTPRVDETVTRRMPEYLLEPGDIVFGRKGAVDRSALVLEDQRGWFLGSDGIRLRLPSSCDARFMSYQFQAPRHREWMMRHAAGTTMASLNEPIILSIPIVLPPLGVQRAIAAVLGALDDKIEQNRRTAQALERLARAIFRAWFVDFEPVKAKAAGATAFPSMPQPVFDALPTRFVDSETGLVPEGWSVVRLDEILTLQRGFDLPKQSRTDGAYPVLTASGLNGWHAEWKVNGPGVTTGRSGVLGRVFFVDQNFWPLNTSLWVKEYKRSNPFHAYFLLKTLDLAQFNSGSAVPTLNRNHIHSLPAIAPPAVLLEAFRETCVSTASLDRQLRTEADKLTELRDYLLPKLLSGTVRINDAERLLEVAQ